MSPLIELARLFGKLGFTAFGGPAAHIAMMEDEVVRRRGWLTRERFLDLLGATNLIPGPNSTEVAISGPLIPRLRRSAIAGAVLDGVNVASLALMASVTIALGRAAIVDVPTAIVAALGAIALVRYKVNTLWIVAGGVVVGAVLALLQ